MNSVVCLILSAKVIKSIQAERFGEHRENNITYALIVVMCCRYDNKCKQYVADLEILWRIEEKMLHICNQIQHMCNFADGRNDNEVGLQAGKIYKSKGMRHRM